MISLVLGIALLGFGLFYFSMLPKIPETQRNLMRIVATINTVGGVAVLVMVMLGIMK